MRLAIIGSRGFEDYDLLRSTMSEWFDPDGGGLSYAIQEVISGGANGADKLGARFARDNNIPLTELLPDWDKYGKRAGFIRNEDIVKSADFVLAFWDGVSRGTGHSLSIAKRLKKPTLIIYF